MIYQIDQSGKIEDTHKLTIIASANSKTKVLKISATEKQTLVNQMREIEFPRKTYIYKIFAGLVFLLLKNYKNIDAVIIDKEYPSHEPDIKLFIIQLFKRTNKNCPEISFGHIGKQSKAHKVALAAFRGEIKPDFIVKKEDLLRLFYTKRKGWRSRSDRDNP